MLPYDDIRLAIVRGLSDYTGDLVIDMNGGGDMPLGDFMTYNLYGFGDESSGQPILVQRDDKTIQQEAVTFTASFMCYADDKDVAMKNALLARDWFKAMGRELLKESLDVIVTDIGEVQNRDINLGEEWERRQGFDVEFRATDIVEYPLRWIEKEQI